MCKLIGRLLGNFLCLLLRCVGQIRTVLNLFIGGRPPEGRQLKPFVRSKSSHTPQPPGGWKSWTGLLLPTARCTLPAPSSQQVGESNPRPGSSYLASHATPIPWCVKFNLTTCKNARSSVRVLTGPCSIWFNPAGTAVVLVFYVLTAVQLTRAARPRGNSE